MKKFLSIVLAVLLLTAVCGTALAAPVQLSSADADTQLSYIFSQISSLKQNEDKKEWKYAITDLDRNGQLELLAASEHDRDHSTTLMAWEVSKNVDAMQECVIEIEKDETFPDIIAESADTMFDVDADTWHYLFYDNITLSDQDAYALKCSVSMKDGKISYDQFAIEHVVIENGNQTVTFQNMSGQEITQADYDSAGVAAFPENDRSSTNFDWFNYADASLTRLTDSYSIFIGEKQPPKPAPSPKPTPGPQFLMITKNPTNEYHAAGENAWFVAGANTWDSLVWTFVAPNGAEYSVSDFAAYFTASNVSGAGGTTLGISNVSAEMNGLGVYCTFRFQGQSARTTTAWLSVTDQPSPTPTPGTMSGTVVDALMSTVTIALDNGTTVQPLRDICDVSGDLDIGCRCDVYYQGYAPSTDNITYVYIYGSSPQPEYGSIGGTISDATMNFVTIALDTGGSVSVSQQVVNMVYGDLTIGCSCLVCFYGDYPTNDNVYEVDVYGSDPQPDPPEPPEPVPGTMGGTAHEGGGGYAIDLDNGSQVYVDSWKCSVEGEFYDGCSAVVYYYDYPSSDNIYSVDIYGSMGLIVPDDDDNDDFQGGWAGSNYYDDNDDFQGGWAGSNYYDNE